MSDAFDATVVIFASKPGSRQEASAGAIIGSIERIGSLVLLPEVLVKPLRAGNPHDAELIADLLATFDLKAVDEEIADASITIGAKYGLRAADAIHLATAVVWGAERFYTHNTKDFGAHITEIDIVVPGAD